MTLAVYIQDVSQSSRRAMLQRPCNLDLLHYKVLTAFEFAKSKPFPNGLKIRFRAPPF